MINPLTNEEEKLFKNCAFKGDLMIIDENELLNNIYGEIFKQNNKLK